MPGTQQKGHLAFQVPFLHVLARSHENGTNGGLTTIINADRIVVMRDGGIAEIGSHEELLARQGFYHHLYTIQFSRSN